MKKYVLTLFALILLAGTSCQEQIDIEKEKEAIKAVIEGEIKASFDYDYESWTNFFVQESYLFWLQAFPKKYYYMKGWQDISSRVKEGFANAKEEDWSKAILNESYDYTIRVYRGAALATFKIKITTVREGNNYEQERLEVRSLEKQDGEWKIAYLGTVGSSLYEEEIEEGEGESDEDEEDEDEEIEEGEGESETEETE